MMWIEGFCQRCKMFCKERNIGRYILEGLICQECRR